MNRTYLGEAYRGEVRDHVGICPPRIVLLLVVSVHVLGLARAISPCDTREKAVLAESPQF